MEEGHGVKTELGSIKEKARASSVQNKQLVKEINAIRDKYEKANVSAVRVY